MLNRLGLAVAAMALVAGACQARECHAVRRAPPPVVHHVRAACGCHSVLHHVRWRHEAVEVAAPVVAASYQIQARERDTWSYRRFGDAAEGYGWRGDAGAHVSATDSYGYLTWPGKHLGEAPDGAYYGDEGYAGAYSDRGQGYDRRTYSRDTYAGEGYAEGAAPPQRAYGRPCPCGGPVPAPPEAGQYQPDPQDQSYRLDQAYPQGQPYPKGQPYPQDQAYPQGQPYPQDQSYRQGYSAPDRYSGQDDPR